MQPRLLSRPVRSSHDNVILANWLSPDFGAPDFGEDTLVDIEPARIVAKAAFLAASKSVLENRLAEVLMSALAPCDLGDEIEVVHDVEAVEIEMDCDIEVDPPVAAPGDDLEPAINHWFASYEEPVNTTPFVREDLGTHQFVRESAPYERIEIQLDANAFMRATIEDARTKQHAP